MVVKTLASTLYSQAIDSTLPPTPPTTGDAPVKVKKKRTMRRKTSEVPTRIYSYRCLAPITEVDRVETQYRLASRFHNVLVEIQHALREKFREIWSKHETVGPVQVFCEEAQANVADAYDELRMAKAGVAEPDLTGPLARLEAAKELAELASEEFRASRQQATARMREIEQADPIVGPLRAAYEEASAVLKAAKKVKTTSLAEKQRLETLKSQAGDAWEKARKIAEDEERLPRDEFRVARAEAARAARATRTSYRKQGVRQGVYYRIEKSVKQAANSTKRPLRFERYDGSGAIGEQLTGRNDADDADDDDDAGADAAPKEQTFGLTIRELMSQADTRLRLGPPGALDPHPRTDVTACSTWDEAMRLPRNARRHVARTWIDLRVGSNRDRSPIFARFPVTLHRLPPKDAVIKWAYVVRRRVGHYLEWRFQLTLESKTFDRSPVAIGEGACAINLGWRRVVNDQGEVIALRAAYVVDENGDEREIRVPGYTPDRRGGRDEDGKFKPRLKQSFSVFDAIEKCDDLASIRDQRLEAIQFTLSAWLADRGGVPAEWSVAESPREDGSVPKTMAERLHGYSAWRAAWKLRRFLDAWKTRRVSGDDQIFDALTAWAKKDRHLEIWQAKVREKVIARRIDTWRVIGTELARKYATIVVGKSKLTEIDGWEQPAPEDGDPSDGKLQRRMARIAAPGELLAEITKAAAKTGAEVRLREEVLATQECNECGCKEPWNARPSITHQCPGCNRTWDQDANHCRNLLKREGLTSGGGSNDTETVPAQHRVAKPKGNSGAATTAVLAKVPK